MVVKGLLLVNRSLGLGVDLLAWRDTHGVATRLLWLGLNRLLDRQAMVGGSGRARRTVERSMLRVELGLALGGSIVIKRTEVLVVGVFGIDVLHM